MFEARHITQNGGNGCFLVKEQQLGTYGAKAAVNRTGSLFLGMRCTGLKANQAIPEKIISIHNTHNVVERNIACFSSKAKTAIGAFGRYEDFLFDQILEDFA
jgi:hypothetical protein